MCVDCEIDGNQKVQDTTYNTTDVHMFCGLKRQSSSLDEVAPIPAAKSSKRTVKAAASSHSHNIREVHADDDFTPTEGSAHQLREFKLMFLKNIKYSFRHKTLFLTATVATLALLTVTQFLVRALELEAEAVPHVLNYNDYKTPHIVSDIYQSTNEGIHMRASVAKLLSKDQGFKNKKVEFGKDIPTEILKEYSVSSEPNNIPFLGIEIRPVRDTGNNSKGKEVDIVKVGITGHFNNQPLHTPPVSVALIDNILMDYLEGLLTRRLKPKPGRLEKGYVPKGYKFNMTNHPLQYQPSDIITYSGLLIGPGYIFGIFVSFSYAFLIAFFIIMHVDEHDFRHLQLVAVANIYIFWGANYLWNLIQFAAVAAIHMLIIAVTGLPGFSRHTWDHVKLLGSMFTFIILYGAVSVCVVGTHASLTFKSWGRGFSRVALFYILTGPLIMLAMIPSQNEQRVSSAQYTFIHNLCMMLPSYSFGSGLFYLIANEVHKEECKKYKPYQNGNACENSFFGTLFGEFDHDGSTLQSCCYNRRSTAFSFVAYGVGRNLFLMLLVAAGCIAQKKFSHSKKMIELERRLFEKVSKQWDPVKINEHEIQDYDVLTEKAKVLDGEEDSNDLTIKNLSVLTPLYHKVDSMCLHLQKGECFALLGSLGAGKTTLLKTLTRYPGTTHTSGDVTLHGLSLTNDFHKDIGYLSYAPDRNPFLPEMTGQEILELVGTLRKVPPNILEQQIAHLAKNLFLEAEMERLVKTYSFVVVKKFCIAAALLGKFEILLLDEPTNHLDPKSILFIISEVKRLMAKGVIVIWTAHSIEQVENICTKTSILVNGHLRCLGSLEHLRDLYEEGFTVIVRFSLDKDMIYFTSKDGIRMEHEIREQVSEQDSATDISRADHRRKTLAEILQEDVEKALNELATWEQDLCPFVAYFERAFPESILVDKQPGFIHYHVHQNKTSWAELFTKMEEAKVVVEVDSYYIASSNLDQVFFNFTRGQVTFDS